MSNLQVKAVQYGIFLCSFWVINTSYMSLITKIFEEKEHPTLAPLQDTIYYIVSMGATFIYPILTLSLKAQNLLAMFSQSLMICAGYLAFLLPQLQFQFICIGAFIGGFGNMFINVANGRYLAALCSGVDEHMKGYYFGVSFAIAGTYPIFGALISFFSLGLMNEDTFLVVMMVLGFVSTLYGWIVLDFDRGGNASSCSGWINSVKQNMKFYSRMKQIIPIIILNGISQSILALTITHLLPQKQSSQRMATIAFLFSSIAAIAGGYLSPRLTDYYSCRTCGFFTLFSFILACILSIIAVLSQILIFSFLAIAIWGFVFTFIDDYLYTVYCKVYNQQVQSYLVGKQVCGITEFLFSILSAVTKNSIPVPKIMLFLLSLSIPSFVGLLFWNDHIIPTDSDSEDSE